MKYLTCVIKGLIFIFKRINFPNPFSTTCGNDSSLRVCPVGAVSNTTTEKFIPFTSLKTTTHRKVINKE